MEASMNPKRTRNIFILFTITYMIGYINRVNYGAIITEMVAATGTSKSLLSVALTGSFFTYGIGQAISGICGDRLSPKRLILCGLIIMSAMNFLLPLCTTPALMTVVWCINGFAQAFLWPPMAKMMCMYVPERDFQRGVVYISWGSSYGTIIIYLIAPLIIQISSWKSVFFFAAVCSAIMAVCWQIFCLDTPAGQKNTVRKAPLSGKGLRFSPLMLCIVLATVIQGALRDGVTTWVPSYISETYNLSSVVCFFSGVVLPLFSILCLQISSRLYERVFKNPLQCAGVFFLIGTVSVALLLPISGNNAPLSAILSAILTGSMQGANLLLVSMIPSFYRKYDRVATMSGFLNACCYAGSAMSTYGLALLAEGIGWHFTLEIWLILAIIGAVLCFSSISSWKKTWEK